ncbi:MAG: uracil-DNA glycosylase [Patescibacteria group bacterium]|nr:uracil-DNA glycosylase [Patescibacteria group bacterium]
MNKIKKLEQLKKKMEEDQTLPLRNQATRLVFGEGNPETKVYFLGEAPGAKEDETGRPFVGPAGKLLGKLLESIGLKREDVYISSVVRFRPPQNRDPKPEEIAAFAPYVDAEIQIICPQIIVTLGRFSLNKFFPEAKISQIHGQSQKINWQGQNIFVVPMYHPAAALRNNQIKKVLEKDFEVIRDLLDSN